MKVFLFIFLLLLLCFTEQGIADSRLDSHHPKRPQQDTLRMHVSSICPFLCLPEEDPHPGVFYEVNQRIFSSAGYKIEPVIVPFARAIEMTQNGEIDILSALYHHEVAGLLYPKQPVLTAIEVFFVFAEDTWRYRDLSSLALLTAEDKIIILKGYDYGSQSFSRYIQENSQQFYPISGEQRFSRAISLLQKKRGRAVAAELAVMRYRLKKQKLNKIIITAGRLHQGRKLFIGISPHTPEANELIRVLDLGLVKLKASGDYQKILNKYGLTSNQVSDIHR